MMQSTSSGSGRAGLLLGAALAAGLGAVLGAVIFQAISKPSPGERAGVTRAEVAALRADLSRVSEELQALQGSRVSADRHEIPAPPAPANPTGIPVPPAPANPAPPATNPPAPAPGEPAAPGVTVNAAALEAAIERALAAVDARRRAARLAELIEQFTPGHLSNARQILKMLDHELRLRRAQRPALEAVLNARATERAEAYARAQVAREFAASFALQPRIEAIEQRAKDGLRAALDASQQETFDHKVAGLASLQRLLVPPARATPRPIGPNRGPIRERTPRSAPGTDAKPPQATPRETPGG